MTKKLSAKFLKADVGFIEDAPVVVFVGGEDNGREESTRRTEN